MSPVFCVSGYVVNFLEWKLGYVQQQGLEGGVPGGGGGDKYDSVSRLDGSQDTNKGKSWQLEAFNDLGGLAGTHWCRTSTILVKKESKVSLLPYLTVLASCFYHVSSLL